MYYFRIPENKMIIVISISRCKNDGDESSQLDLAQDLHLAAVWPATSLTGFSLGFQSLTGPSRDLLPCLFGTLTQSFRGFPSWFWRASTKQVGPSLGCHSYGSSLTRLAVFCPCCPGQTGRCWTFCQDSPFLLKFHLFLSLFKFAFSDSPNQAFTLTSSQAAPLFGPPCSSWPSVYPCS